MCRLMAYLGTPCLLADLVTKPSRSLTRQSYDAKERLTGHGYLNGDGFGIGWYSTDSQSIGETDPTPCVFSSIQPAWNNLNLERLANKIVSQLIFAHVRAAYPGIAVSDSNCQPFTCGRYMWMHNGTVGGFHKVRRRLLNSLRDEVYENLPSFESDSAICFGLFLNHIEDPMQSLPPQELVALMEATINDVKQMQAEAGVEDEESLLNFVVSDGQTVVATRYCNLPNLPAASLYYAFGSKFDCVDRETNAYFVQHEDRRGKLGIIASEPLTDSSADWIKVPQNHMVIMTQHKGSFLDLLLVPIGAQQLVSKCFKSLASCTRQCSKVSLHSRQPVRRLGEQPHNAGSSPTKFLGRNNSGRSTPPQLVPPPSGIPLSTSPRHSLVGPTCPVHSLAVHGERLFAGLQDGSIAIYSLTDFTCEHSFQAHRHNTFALTVTQGMLYSSSTRVVKIWDVETMELRAHLRYSDGDVFALALALGRSVAGPAGTTIVACGKAPTSTSALRHTQSSSLPASTAKSKLPPIQENGLHPPDPTGERQESTSTVPTKHGTAVPDEEHQMDPGYAEQRDVLKRGGAEDSVGNMLKLGSKCSRGREPRGKGEGEGRHGVNGSLIPEATPGVFDRLEEVRGGASADDLSTRGAPRDDTAASSSCSADTSDESIGLCDASTQQQGALPARPCCSTSVPGINPTQTGKQQEQQAPGPPCPSQRLPSIKIVGDKLECAEVEAALALTDTARGGHCSRVYTLALCNSLLCSGGGDSFVKVWDVDTGACAGTLAGHKGVVLALAPYEDTAFGTWSLISGSRDNTVRIWDLTSLTCITTLTGHTDDVVGLTLAHPCCTGFQKTFFSASADQTVRLWSLESYECLRVFLLEDSVIMSIASTPTGFVTGSSDGVIHCWELDDDPQERGGRGTITLSPNFRHQPSTTREEHQLMEETLSQLVRIRSVTQERSPAATEQAWKAANFLMGLLEGIGAEAKLVVALDGTHPIVFGRIVQDPSKLTVTLCGHYDVADVQSDSGWRTPPFQLTAVNGDLYGRGVSTSKGPLVATLFAVKELVCSGELAVNLNFIIDGEHERGSQGVKEAVESNFEWFEDTGLILTSTGAWISDEQPCLTYGMRGLLCLEVGVTGPSKDLHSGTHGGVFNEPTNDLVTVLSNLVDSNNMILVPGFYDDVKPMDDEENKLYNRLQLNLEEFKATNGLKALTGHTPREVLQSCWRDPSLSIVSVECSSGAWSLVPKGCTAKVVIRHVPDQNPERLIERFRAHVEHEFAKLRSKGNTISVKVQHVGDWWLAEPSCSFYKLAEKAVQKNWPGAPPTMYIREGGTTNVVPFLKHALGAPAIIIPISQATDYSALQNEKLSLKHFLRGKNVLRDFLIALGED